MATTEAFSDQNQFRGDPVDDEFEYRPLSTAAIASAVFGVLSLLTFAAGRDSLQSCMLLCPIPMIGIAVGWSALSKIRKMPDQFSGKNAAMAGVWLSLIGLFGGLGFAGYVHATEVPDGYVRTSFQEFRPDEVDSRSDVVVPKDVQQLNGQKVFIKGFIRPGTTVTKDGTPVRQHAGRFLLVRDSNECCFGDMSKLKYFDQILVTMAGSKTVDDARGLIRVGGTLSSNPDHLRLGQGVPVYLLEADYLK